MFDYEKVIPAPIPMKRQPAKRNYSNVLHPMYSENIAGEAKATSKKFREKVEADLKRLGLK